MTEVYKCSQDLSLAVASPNIFADAGEILQDTWGKDLSGWHGAAVKSFDLMP